MCKAICEGGRRCEENAEKRRARQRAYYRRRKAAGGGSVQAGVGRPRVAVAGSENDSDQLIAEDVLAAQRAVERAREARIKAEAGRITAAIARLRIPSRLSLSELERRLGEVENAKAEVVDGWRASGRVHVPVEPSRVTFSAAGVPRFEFGNVSIETPDLPVVSRRREDLTDAHIAYAHGALTRRIEQEGIMSVLFVGPERDVENQGVGNV